MRPLQSGFTCPITSLKAMSYFYKNEFMFLIFKSKWYIKTTNCLKLHKFGEHPSMNRYISMHMCRFLITVLWTIIHRPYNSSFQSIQIQSFLVFSQNHAIITTIKFEDIFLTPRRNAISISSHCPFPSILSCWTSLIHFLSLQICLFWTYHISGIIQYGIFCDSLLST